MAMNPRTHPRGAPPDFSLPKPNPNPQRMTDALWWLVCMREALEPDSQNGGTYANKAGYHNIGDNLPDYGPGNARTDHSIRRGPDRAGPWWTNKTSAHDWTFPDAQRGDYRTINKYTKRQINAMRDPNDLRPDDVYAYVLGQVDGDVAVEGYNEYRDDAESSADKTHLWHIHDSFRRNIIGQFAYMWRALTIDMGWTFAEWQKSIAPTKPEGKPVTQPADETIKLTATAGKELFEPDKPAGTEVSEDTVLQLAAIWAKRSADSAAAALVQVNSNGAALVEVQATLATILALLQEEPTEDTTASQ